MDDGTRDYLTDVHKSVFLDWTQQHTSDLYSVAERRYDSWMRAVKAQIWDEAYRRGVDDARIADDLRVDVGLGPDLYAQPARQNPYRASETA